MPATVSVITAQEIEENLVTDIKDLIQYEPGVSVRSASPRFGAALAGRPGPPRLPPGPLLGAEPASETGGGGSITGELESTLKIRKRRTPSVIFRL